MKLNEQQLRMLLVSLAVYEDSKNELLSSAEYMLERDPENKIMQDLVETTAERLELISDVELELQEALYG